MQKLHLDSPTEYKELEEENDMYGKFTLTSDGFLKGRAVVTNIGIFPYLVDGRVVNRLRTPEEVLDEESLDSLKMMPLTDNHPSEAVNSENIKNYQVGHLGTDIRTDGYSISADIIITDAETIKKVKAGKVALSCGYFSDIEEVSGRKWGQTYDSKQTNIRYNHVAIVDVGRAGDDAVMLVDSLSESFIVGLATDGLSKPQEENDHKEENMKKIIVDNKEIEVAADAANEILAIVKDRDSFLADKAVLETKVTSLEAQVDAFKEEKVKLEAEKASVQDSLEGLVAAGVNAKMEVLEIAKKLKVELDSKESVSELKKKIVLSQSDKKEVLSATIEAKGSAYLDARFDHIVENFNDVQIVNDQIGKVVLDSEGKAQQEANEGKVLSADEARDLYTNSILNKKVK